MADFIELHRQGKFRTIRLNGNVVSLNKTLAFFTLGHIISITDISRFVNDFHGQGVAFGL